MLFEHIDLFDENFDIRHDMFVGVEGTRIAYIGAEEPVQDFGERYDGRNKVLLPAFYNAHAHAPMTLLRGYAENLPLQRWLNEMIFPFEDFIDDESAYPAIMLAAAEMFRFGIVSFSDMYYFEDGRYRGIAESGIKCNMSHSIINFSDASYEQLPAYQVNKHLVEDYHNTLDNRVLVDLCIHAEYTNTPKVIEAVGSAACELGLRTQIHLSETESEHEECKGRHGGLTPAAFFDSLGFFEQPCTAAHCVYAEPADIELFARKGVSVATCPASNMKLASGFAPIREMLEAGVNVALGTDGPASNNSHAMLDDLRLLALITKGSRLDPTLVTPKQALKVATRNGALAQGREDCGLIKEGFRADLCVFDIDTPWMQPVHNLTTNLVFSAMPTDVVLTMCDGRVVYRDGVWPTVDVAWAQAETQRFADAIVAKVAASK